ncbi:type I methionyl aminopeptidase [Saccharopolyspora rectivirgula]|uniref:Methionine aminopeptidase n=1 Tax=Saccharopolyspora rectivirgula TaxID=28042 RepID=A0A073B829_9PSEU|nr:type I methionyl aminopeptidase [Saccharopolyspora rectivirgula]KEI43859.1 methionine aminopeptidase [Saccharopolyspora rectivirgula]
MIELKTKSEVEAMREAGRVVARALQAVREHAAVGVSLRELDEVAHAVITEAGAEPLFLGYHPSWAPSPFPAVVCTSVNEVVVHGIPSGRRLQDGDLLSVDCGARLDGWCGDAAISLVVGEPRAQDKVLIDTAEQALADGVAAAVPGGRLGDVSHAIGVVGRGAGYGIPGMLGGHGIGRQMHEKPFVPNRGPAGTGTPLRPGLVLAIEPMFISGGDDGVSTAGDGWKVVADDGSRAVHVEHTVAITEDGPQVLTLP